MRSISKLPFIVPFLCISVHVLSQTPIALTTMVQVPPPRYLYEFASKTQIMAYPVTTEDVNLRITIKGDNGIRIYTSPNYNPFSIVFTAAPVLLTGMDIESYFLPQNLIFTGITASKMQESGLPPGNYQVCVRVMNIDGTFISGDDPLGCSNLFSILEADPPFLVNPVCGTVINQAISNGIVFSWTPSAGAPPLTSYTLRITEFPQEGMNPASVLLSATTPMFFEKEITGFTYFYGPVDPPLQSGKSYAWEVVAKNSEHKTWFKNNGHSEACWFRYAPQGGLVIVPPVIPSGPTSTPSPNLYPSSVVSGVLKYTYNAGTGTTPTVSVGSGNNGTGSGVFIGNTGSIPWGGGSSSFQYNAGLGSTNTKPLANINISLVRKYIIKKGYFKTDAVENYVIPDVGYYYMPEFNQKFPNSGQVMATTKTDENGNFKFTFINSDSIGQVKDNFSYSQGPSEFQDNIKGTVYSTFRIVVESPYYCSPENDIIVQPWEVKNAGDVVSLAKDYNLKVIVKSVKTSIQQTGGGNNPLNDVEVNIVRNNPPPGIPKDEGQNLNTNNPKGPGTIISKNKTGQDGSALFTRMIRHQKDLTIDRYTLQCSTNKQKGNYNYVDKSVKYNATFQNQMANFPFTGDPTKTVWNSQYKLETKEFEVGMWPDKPRIIGRVVNSQGKAMPGVKCVILSIYQKPENYNPANLFRVVESDVNGNFAFNDLDVEIGGQFPDLLVEGPKRTFMLKVNGYKYFEKVIGTLILGQQTDLGTIALEPDGLVNGKVIDDEGTSVQATVVFNNQISVNTSPIFTINPFAVHQVFSASVPSGSIKVKVIPSNQEYAQQEYTFTINKSTGGASQNLGDLKVYKSKHRITFTLKEKVSGKPVKDVQVKIKNSDVAPVNSNAQGQVNLSFSSMTTSFVLELTPPDDKDLLPLGVSITNQNSTSAVDYGVFLIEPAARISGTVTYGNDKKPLAGADVFLDQGTGGTAVLVKTDASGKYVMGKIPMNPPEAVITAGKSEPGITIIAQTKTVDVTKVKTVDFQLPVFDKMSITDIYGFPVIVETLTDNGTSATISGKFNNLPANENFKIEESNFMMEFSNIKMVKLSETTPEGVPLTKPEQNEVKTSTQSIPVKVHNEFYATHTPSSDFFSIKPDAEGSGYIEGKVKIENSSFQFSSSVLSFNQEAIYLGETGSNSATVKSITAKPSSKRVFAVMDDKGGPLNYQILGFDAVGKQGKCTLDGATIKLNSTLSTSGIALMNPQKFELDIGDLIVKKTGFDPVSGNTGFDFKLEKWSVSAEKWNLSKEQNYILVLGGKVKTGLSDVPFNTMNIGATGLSFTGFKFGNMSLSGVVPLEILTNNINMLLDPSTGADMKPHWRLAAIGLGGQPAARIKGLPGMEPNTNIDFQVFETISNNENKVSFGSQNQIIPFYKVYKMKPVSLSNYDNYFQLSGLVDLGIPRVDNSFTGILQFSKSGGSIAMEVKTLPVSFKGPGKVNFTNISLAGTQKLDPSGFEAKGKIKDEEGLELLVTLYRKPNDIYLDVQPAGQILHIGDSDIQLTDVKGKMMVKNNDWDFFRFDGIMTGANGVEGQQRLDFTIYGAIEANSQSVSLKNINTPFGGMNITYDFKHGRMTGDLNINSSLGGIGVTGTANLLVDKDGYYIIAGGSAFPPGIGLIQAGMMFGNYSSITGDAKSRLMMYAYDKNLPPSFANGISGFFITGRKNVPVDIPDIDVDLGVVSVAFGAEVGADARVWMNFAGPGSSFGIGAMVFAHAYFVCQSMVCTSFGADARAELGMKGDYNTAAGTFSLQGCGSISISAHGEQCIGAFSGCIGPCVDLGFNKSIKVDLLLNSQGSASIDLGLGNCSGQPPLTGGW